VLPAAPRWRALPIVSAAKAAVGTALSITRGAWSGPSLDSDTLEVMRCTNVCVVVGSAGSYTISSADVGAVLRLRETAANAGGTTVVWSAQYVGPVTSASAAAADVGQGQALLRNAKGAVLAIADVAGRPAAAAGDTSGGHLVFGRMLVRSRVVRITRARGVHGKLKAWVCPVAGRRGAAPPACTAKVSLQARASVKLPRWMLTGRVRVVVVRQG
jgi:hypothetical protein